MQPITPILVLYSVLFPARLWYPPDQPITINIKSEVGISLLMTDFLGKVIEPAAPAQSEGTGSLDLRQFFPQLTVPGVYLLYAAPRGKDIASFIGTPLVIDIRRDWRRDAPADPMVVSISPLCYA